MAKHKSQQVLFDLLRRDGGRAQGPPAPAVPPVQQTAVPGTAQAVPPARPEHAPRREAAAFAARPFSAAAAGPLLFRQVSVPVSHLLLGALTAVCLIAIAFAVGMRYGPERLPATEKHPTFREVQDKGPTPGLVAPGPSRPLTGNVAAERPAAAARPAPSSPAPVPPAGGSAKTTGPAAPARPAAETPVPPGPHYRVRIVRLAVSQPETIDKMRAFLSQKGVETELDTRSGYYVLYGRDRFTDKKKADDLAAEVNRHLAEFEKVTHIPTSKDAYSILVTKE